MESTEQRVEVSCRSCGAQILFGLVQRTARCPCCDSPSVVDRPATDDRPDPVFGLGFVVARDDAARRMRHWIRGRKMAPFGLKDHSADRVRGAYLPAYLYSATAHTSYCASIGERYKDEDETIDLTLVPLWVFAIRYDDEKPPIRVLVNGQTGKVFGHVPLSWAKVGLIAAGILALIGLVRLLAWLVP